MTPVEYKAKKSMKIANVYDFALLPPSNYTKKVSEELALREHAMGHKLCVVWPGLGALDGKALSKILELFRLKEIFNKLKAEETWMKTMKDHPFAHIIQDTLNWSQNGTKFIRVGTGPYKYIDCEDISTLFCDRWLNDTVIEAILLLLNNQIPTEKFIMWKPHMKVDKIVKDMGTVSKIHIIFSVFFEGGNSFIAEGTEGKHFSYLCLQLSGGLNLYGDSLGWPVPANLGPSISKFVKALNEKYKLSLDPERIDPACTVDLSRFSPLQEDQTSCGLGALLFCIARLGGDSLWGPIVGLTAPHRLMFNLTFWREFSEHKRFIRGCAIKWLVTNSVQINDLHKSLSARWNLDCNTKNTR